MVEVFKTNVKDLDHAKMLIDQIHKNFIDYKANFDLQDCDNILRVEYTSGMVQASHLIDLLKDFGFKAEVLPDDDPPIFRLMFARAVHKYNSPAGR
jgi:hypothetical protein